MPIYINRTVYSIRHQSRHIRAGITRGHAPYPISFMNDLPEKEIGPDKGYRHMDGMSCPMGHHAVKGDGNMASPQEIEVAFSVLEKVRADSSAKGKAAMLNMYGGNGVLTRRGTCVPSHPGGKF